MSSPLHPDFPSDPPWQRRRAQRPGFGALVLALLVALLLGGALVGVGGYFAWREGILEPPVAPSVAAPALPPQPRSITPRADLAESERSTIELFQSASPGVVFITTVDVRRDFRLNVLQIPKGSGSGFVWDQQGHVVTNFHVIQNADGARVTLADGSVFPARLVGHDADNDLAVLRIDAPPEKLAPVALGSSSDLVVGQSVFAIGNPFGFDQTLSVGVISGLGREITSVTGRPIQGVIQTDAVINPGNSGGPLLDSSGRIIGVNTAIFSPTGAFAGIGFAVPMDTVSHAIPQLIEHGRVTRPILGIQIADDSVASRLGVRGVMIVRVIEGGPADNAGLQSARYAATGHVILGDIIIAINGEPVRQSKELFRILDRHKVGETVTLTLRRNTERVEVELTLAADG